MAGDDDEPANTRQARIPGATNEPQSTCADEAAKWGGDPRRTSYDGHAHQLPTTPVGSVLKSALPSLVVRGLTAREMRLSSRPKITRHLPRLGDVIPDDMAGPRCVGHWRALSENSAEQGSPQQTGFAPGRKPWAEPVVHLAASALSRVAVRRC